MICCFMPEMLRYWSVAQQGAGPHKHRYRGNTNNSVGNSDKNSNAKKLNFVILSDALINPSISSLTVNKNYK